MRDTGSAHSVNRLAIAHREAHEAAHRFLGAVRQCGGTLRGYAFTREARAHGTLLLELSGTLLVLTGVFVGAIYELELVDRICAE